MHPSKLYRVEDRAKLLAFIKERGFGTLVITTEEGLKGVSIPFVVDDCGTSLRFHLARSNTLAAPLKKGCAVFLTVNGPDAYISPDWYESADQVPTWNYVAVHIQGACAALPEDSLPQHLDDLSAEHENRLTPKVPWTSGKMDPNTYARMRAAIVPYEVTITSMEGTWKLSQNKQAVDFDGAIAGLEGREDVGSIAIAKLMRR